MASGLQARARAWGFPTRAGVVSARSALGKRGSRRQSATKQPRQEMNGVGNDEEPVAVDIERRLAVETRRVPTEQDVEDARGVWRARGRLMDASRIASVLAQLEEALGQSDLSPVFEEIRRSP